MVKLVSCGVCSFLLGPGAHKVLIVPSKSLFPQSCVSCGGSLPLQQATANPYPLRRYSDTVLAQCLWGLWVLVHTRFVRALKVSLAGIGFDSKCDFAPPTVLLGLLLCLWTWDTFFFFGVIQHSPVDGCSAASCNFGLLTGEDERMSFYSAILI